MRRLMLTHQQISGPDKGPVGFYRPELDALRFFAFLAVFFHHALPQDLSLYVGAGIPQYAAEWMLTAKKAGAFGLDLFFTLSAYLITELLLRESASRGRIDVRSFYIRRALRIWPLYFVFLALTAFIVPRILPKDDFGIMYMIPYALFSGNWACVVWGIPFSVASPLWSISVEEQFYIVWPLLLTIFGLGRIRQIAVVFIVFAFVTRVALALSGATDAAVWCHTVVRLDTIALGAILAFSLQGRTPQLRRSSRMVLCLAAVLLWLGTARYLKLDGLSSIVTYALSAIASVMLLGAVLREDAGLLRRTPFSALVYLGKISYGLYVFHLLALTIISKQASLPVFGIPLNFERRIALSLIFTVLLAALSYQFLERPFLMLKRRFSHVPSRSERQQSSEPKKSPATVRSNPKDDPSDPGLSTRSVR